VTLTDAELAAARRAFKASIDYVQRDSDIWLSEDVAEGARRGAARAQRRRGLLAANGASQQTNASLWGLDAVDSPALPLDGLYGYGDQLGALHASSAPLSPSPSLPATGCAAAALLPALLSALPRRDPPARIHPAGTGVNVYVLDTGILTTHDEFGPYPGGGGSAWRAVPAFDAVGQGNTTDEHGHGAARLGCRRLR